MTQDQHEVADDVVISSAARVPRRVADEYGDELRHRLGKAFGRELAAFMNEVAAREAATD